MVSCLLSMPSQSSFTPASLPQPCLFLNSLNSSLLYNDGLGSQRHLSNQFDNIELYIIVVTSYPQQFWWRISQNSNGINFGRSSYLGGWRGKLHLKCFMTTLGTIHKGYFVQLHPMCWIKVCLSPLHYVNHWIQKIEVSFIHSAFFFFFHPIFASHSLIVLLILWYNGLFSGA